MKTFIIVLLLAGYAVPDLYHRYNEYQATLAENNKLRKRQEENVFQIELLTDQQQQLSQDLQRSQQDLGVAQTTNAQLASSLQTARDSIQSYAASYALAMTSARRLRVVRDSLMQEVEIANQRFDDVIGRMQNQAGTSPAPVREYQQPVKQVAVQPTETQSGRGIWLEIIVLLSCVTGLFLLFRRYRPHAPGA